MVKFKEEQFLHNGRGFGEQFNEKFSWIPTSLESRVIVCFCAQSSREPNWGHISNDCHKNGVKAWELKHKIDQPKVLYTAVDSKRKSAIRSIANRSNVTSHWKVAYPSETLKYQIEEALRQAHLYGVSEAYVGTISEDIPGVYLFFEDKHVLLLYVGLTMSLSARFSSHLRERTEIIPRYLQWVFRNADGPEAKNLGQWSLRFIPFEQPLGFAVQGQLAPDLDSNPSARISLETRFKENPAEGLLAAEAALIAHFCPHFNSVRNTYPDPLPQLRQMYCQEHCSVCSARQDGSRSEKRKRAKV